MKIFHSIIFAALLLLSGCAETPKNDPGVQSFAVMHPITQVRGLLTMNNGRAMLSDQFNNSVHQVIDKTGQLDSAYNAAAAPCHYPAEYVYAVLTGKFTGPDKIERGNFELTQIDTMLPKSPENLTSLGVPFDFWCHGNEPFWSIQVSNYEGGIFYENISDGSAWLCPWIRPVESKSKDTWTYNVPEAMGKNQAFSLTIRKGKCDDGMSETVYEYSADLKMGGNVFHGVAKRGTGRIMGPKPINHQ